MAVPDIGASFTVYQPGFVITARELKWSLWMEIQREGWEQLKNQTEKGVNWGGTTKLNFKETETNKIYGSPMGRDEAGRKVFFTYSSLYQQAHLSAPVAQTVPRLSKPVT